MLKIKVSIPGHKYVESLKNFIPANFSIETGVEIHVNPRNVLTVYDAWFVIEDLKFLFEVTRLKNNTVIFLQSESAHDDGFYLLSGMKKFLESFTSVYGFSRFPVKSIYSTPFLPWMVNHNHGDNVFLDVKRNFRYYRDSVVPLKTECLSVICSNKIDTPGQELRFNFVKALKDHFGDRLHWYGNGVMPIENKWQALEPYKYSIAIENIRKDNVFSEKLYDCFLSGAIPIYYGAENIHSFFSPKSLVKIDINDISLSIKTIEECINSKFYEKSISYLCESKQKVLFDYNLFYRIANIANSVDVIGKPVVRFLTSARILRTTF
jgi:hypothetical protein